jgi:hypothetical protein
VFIHSRNIFHPEKNYWEELQAHVIFSTNYRAVCRRAMKARSTIKCWKTIKLAENELLQQFTHTQFSSVPLVLLSPFHAQIFRKQCTTFNNKSYQFNINDERKHPNYVNFEPSVPLYVTSALFLSLVLLQSWLLKHTAHTQQQTPHTNTMNTRLKKFYSIPVN